MCFMVSATMSNEANEKAKNIFKIFFEKEALTPH